MDGEQPQTLSPPIAVAVGRRPRMGGRAAARAFMWALPFVVLAFFLGILPQTLIFNWVDPSITGWVANMSVLK